MSKESENIIAC